jgi:hypothetical protein
MLHGMARHPAVRSLADLRRLVLTRASGPSADAVLNDSLRLRVPTDRLRRKSITHTSWGGEGLPLPYETAYVTSPPLPLGEGWGEGAFVAPHKTPSPGLRPASPRGRGGMLEGAVNVRRRDTGEPEASS